MLHKTLLACGLISSLFYLGRLETPRLTSTAEGVTNIAGVL